MPAKRPEKTTREQIEAELKDSELDNALEDVREALLQFEEFESCLKVLEQKVWQPHWSHDDPLLDRLTRVSVSRDELKKVAERINDIWIDNPTAADIQKQLDRDVARKSALEQLGKLLASRHK